jgi:hypothetical protein
MLKHFFKFFEKNQSEYSYHFDIAVLNSKKYGLGIFKKLDKNIQPFLNEDTISKFADSVASLDLSSKDLMAQCHKVHMEMKHHVDTFFDTDTIVTIGHLQYKNGEKKFYESMETRLNALKNGYDITEPLKLHTWLTFPTGEILDLTYYSTLAEAKRQAGVNADDIDGLAILGNPDNAKHMPHKYIPEFLGKEFFEKTGLLKHYTAYFF